jgi:hypothetical protein
LDWLYILRNSPSYSDKMAQVFSIEDSPLHQANVREIRNFNKDKSAKILLIEDSPRFKTAGHSAVLIRTTQKQWGYLLRSPQNTDMDSDQISALRKKVVQDALRSIRERKEQFKEQEPPLIS